MTMYHITREIDFCYGHRLLNYDGKCRFLHGHNGRAVIKIAAETLDERGMVFDFSDVWCRYFGTSKCRKIEFVSCSPEHLVVANTCAIALLSSPGLIPHVLNEFLIQ